MADSPISQYRAWGLDDCLAGYPHMRIAPTVDGSLRLRGELEVRATGPDGTTVDDVFQIELAVPPEFPRVPPDVRETAGRIPDTFHKLGAGRFCLGSPTAVRLQLLAAPTLCGFIERLVVPYLFGFSFFEKYGRMPYGELEHGTEGIRQHFAELFGMPTRAAADGMVRLAVMPKRIANKHPCPCGSGRRLGRCHNRAVNRQRRLLGRKWFGVQSQLLGL